MAVITCIDDLKAIYAKKTPKMFYDYAESGSYTEQTFRENVSDFAKIRLRQRVAVDLTGRTTESTMIGEKVAMPVALSPVGSCGMQSPDGEIKAARAALNFGVPFTLSTMSICSIEDVASATKAPFWFQLYVMQDEEFVDNIIQRAKNAGVSALVLTLDLQLLGQRHKDLKNGLSAPPKPTLKNILDMAIRPQWSLEMLGTSRRTFRNIVGHAKNVGNVSSLSSWTNEQFDPRLDWDKVAKLKEKWGGPFILKGILDAEDAKKATEIGADAIIVSNHGGRQLDGARSAVSALPAIVDAVEGRIEVLMDGGIRRGADVVKAMALGASACLIGRAGLYGLAAGGEHGVLRAIDILRTEIDITLALLGQPDITRLGRDCLASS